MKFSKNHFQPEHFSTWHPNANAHPIVCTQFSFLYIHCKEIKFGFQKISSHRNCFIRNNRYIRIQSIVSVRKLQHYNIKFSCDRQPIGLLTAIIKNKSFCILSVCLFTVLAGKQSRGHYSNWIYSNSLDRFQCAMYNLLHFFQFCVAYGIVCCAYCNFFVIIIIHIVFGMSWSGKLHMIFTQLRRLFYEIWCIFDMK